MKQLSKIMLAAVASVALAVPALAWDFGASGSSSATWKQVTVTPATGDATVDTNFTSSSGGVTVSSSNSDGPNTATFSYTADWNGDAGNFDEYVTVSGSKKVGNWTASSSTSQYMNKDATAGASPMTAGGTAAITLTDGSITYKLGDAGHLSNAEKTSGGPMGGIQDAEARVDSFNGFSVGLGVGPGTLTVALDMHSGTSSVFFGEALDGDDNATTGADTATACGSDSTGFGINFAGDVGADLTFTYATGSSSAKPTCTGDASSNATSMNTMGLGVAIDLGDIDPFISFGTAEGTAGSAANSKVKHAHSGNEVGLTYALGADTITLLIGSMSDQQDTQAAVDKPQTTSIMEVGYATMVGPASLSVGYGTSAKADADKGTSNDGYSKTDLDVALSISF